jgi:hypothetical protein
MVVSARRGIAWHIGSSVIRMSTNEYETLLSSVNVQRQPPAPLPLCAPHHSHANKVKTSRKGQACNSLLGRLAPSVWHVNVR